MSLWSGLSRPLCSLPTMRSQLWELPIFVGLRFLFYFLATTMLIQTLIIVFKNQNNLNIEQYVLACSVALFMSDSLRACGLQPPDSSVHAVLQARILELAAMPFARGSSQLRDRTHVTMSLALAGELLIFIIRTLGSHQIVSKNIIYMTRCAGPNLSKNPIKLV